MSHLDRVQKEERKEGRKGQQQYPGREPHETKAESGPQDHQHRDAFDLDREWFSIKIVEIKEKLRLPEWTSGLGLRVRRGAKARVSVGALSSFNTHEELVEKEQRHPVQILCHPGAMPGHVYCPILVELSVTHIQKKLYKS